ncbi:pentatricopeptide repeat-containing protein At1g71490-like [Juglans microcarpa x Juglans regia]|uniref:pentatricopeptide repeat-containing protein At1g71490-like n=1 Tax=Juglans microcarpa x Juglans regia TaxID=2249226 RepID=UPI001B7DF787|nr:pentatricopeptide repeat-containing protein At1g71490-like [Juglans microcarpa x Juglans regia]XP_041009097.1 pentatricopeptide repeat-containing protein At1g71490-like [Juglans microcarpa x Juglans regia]XP_041009098.1 pentatricopeptide repeat-containing protein At1g71490-like [Juglans microcarpa x Juglans regia]
MPSSQNLFILRGLSISQVQKFIPRKWKQGIKQCDKPSMTCSSNDSVLETNTSSDESMINSLFACIKDFANQGHLSKAFKTFSLIQLHASSLASYDLILHPLSSLLLCCTNLKSFPQGKQLHAQIISLGLEQHPVLVPKLVTFYSSFNLLVEASIITQNSGIFHPLPWNLLISSYVRNELFGEALSAFKHMVDRGIRPDNFTYPSVLKACGEKLDLGFGREVHNIINSNSVEWNLFVHNALVSMYGRFGEIDVARSLFDKMPERDEVSWNTMISAYASRGMWGKAFELFENMRTTGIEVNIIIWNTIASGCLRTGNFKGALDLLSQMRAFGIHLDSVAIIIGLGACSHIGVIKLGKEMHGSAIRSCSDGFDNVKNALITMYSRCKDLRHAYILFRLIENKSLITWNSMLSGYSHMDQSEEASFLFREMLLSRIEPNYVTIASILPLCARVANLQHGKEFHCYITKREEFKGYLLLWNALVDMYARSGKVIEAKRVFDALSERDEVTYTSLIAGYGMQGEGHAALKVFEEMKGSGTKPDHITMVAILSACSHSGLVVQGQRIFEKMPTVYGINPRLEHYACMVDLFGRAGLLNKAKEIITTMPYRPTPAMWATLLGACRIHGNTDIGEWAAQKLLEMRPKNSGYYVLIANMYAASGCWNNLAKVRTSMRDLGVKKAPARAWVDVGMGFSPFGVGDTSNPYAQEIYTLLDGLTELMKDAGYVASEDFGSEDEIIE